MVLKWRECGLFSYGLLDAGYMSVCFLTLGLVIGMAIYLAMCDSSVRKYPRLMAKWYSYFMWLMYLGYAFFFIGLIFWMLALAYAVSLSFPWYQDKNWWNKDVTTTTAGGTDTNLVEEYQWAPWQPHQYGVQRASLALSILVPIVSVVFTKILMANHVEGEEGVGNAVEMGSNSTMEDLVKHACMTLNGISEQDQSKAVVLLTKDGYSTELDLAKEIPFIDFAADFPQFPKRVKRALLRHFALNRGTGSSGAKSFEYKNPVSGPDASALSDSGTV
jgi:hypothetical protein